MEYDPNKALPYVLPGQRVVTASGQSATVAFVQGSVVWAWVGLSPVPRPVIVVTDAWGGESDMDVRNQARAA